MKAQETDSLIQEVSWRKVEKCIKGGWWLLCKCSLLSSRVFFTFVYTSLYHRWICNEHISEVENLQKLILMLRTLIRDFSRMQPAYVFTFTATCAVNTDIQVQHMVWTFLNTEASSLGKVAIIIQPE